MATENTPLLQKPTKLGDIVIKIYENGKSLNDNIPPATTLSYEELLTFIVDPYWIKVRKISFILLCIMFVVILAGACIKTMIAIKTTSACIAMTSNNKNDMNHTIDDVKNLTYVVLNKISRDGG